MRNFDIILGSQSPRRRELLAMLDIPFTAVTIDADESFPQHLKAGDIPQYIAIQKAQAYRNKLQDNQLLITADTIVWLPDTAEGGTMLGKPQNEAEAEHMLQLLSARTHQVYTAVCLTTKTKQEVWVDSTDVSFREMSKEEIAQYVKKYHPLDKAGAYGVQEWIGAAACTAMNGSYYNVMGLPTHKLYKALQAF